jgi:hypothetical protein
MTTVMIHIRVSAVTSLSRPVSIPSVHGSGLTLSVIRYHVTIICEPKQEDDYSVVCTPFNSSGRKRIKHHDACVRCGIRSLSAQVWKMPSSIDPAPASS